MADEPQTPAADEDQGVPAANGDEQGADPAPASDGEGSDNGSDSEE